MGTNQESQTYRFAARIGPWLTSFRPLTLFSLATITLCIVFFSLSLTCPYIGAEVKYTGGEWRIATVDPSGLAQEAKVEPGDRVIQVNGGPVEEFARQYVYPDLIRQKSIHQLLVIDGDNHQKSASIEGSPLPKAALFESVALFLTAIAFCVIGTFVFLKRPANPAARVLYLLCLAIAVCLVSVLASERNIGGALALSIAANACFPWLGVHLFMMFPVRIQLVARSRFLPYIIYWPVAMTLLIYALFGRVEGEEPTLWLRSTVFLSMSLGLLLLLACIVHSYLTTTYVRHKQQIKIMGAGTAVAIVPFAALSILPEVAKGVTFVAPQFAVLSTIFIPLSLGYALVKYQLMDIDLIIRRGIVHGSLLLLIAGCYAALGYGLSMWLPVGDGMARVLYTAALVSLGLLSYRIVADKAQLAIDHALFKDRYDYKRAMASVAVMLSSATDLAELADKVTTTMSQLLALRGACLLLFTEGEGPKTLSAYGTYVDDESEQQRSLAWASHLSEEDQFPNEAPAESGAAFFVPLTARNKLVAILCLAPKAARTNFSEDDLSLLFTLSRQLGVAIQNALLVEEARRHEEQLRESERLYSTMASSSQVGIFIVQGGNFVFVNPQFQKDMGFSGEELVGANVLGLVHPEDREMARQKAVEMLREEFSAPYEYRVITKNGETRVGMGTIVSIHYNGQMAYLGCHMDITERKRAEEALRRASLETLDAVSTIIEANDPYTAGHSSRVTDLAVQIAMEKGMRPEQLNDLRVAGLLHDTGKVGIPESVLNKPAKLNQAEWLMIKAHPVISAHTAGQVAAFKDAVPAIRHHHERWDGTGYPDGLKGEAIPLLARILAVADAFEAMTSERPYRPARTEEEALTELQKGAGTQWDPDVVSTFLRMMSKRNHDASV